MSEKSFKLLTPAVSFEG